VTECLKYYMYALADTWNSGVRHDLLAVQFTPKAAVRQWQLIYATVNTPMSPSYTAAIKSSLLARLQVA
jgi:hypothetical protein